MLGDELLREGAEYCTDGDEDLEGEYPDEPLLRDGVLLLYDGLELCSDPLLRVVL